MVGIVGGVEDGCAGIDGDVPGESVVDNIVVSLRRDTRIGGGEEVFW